MLGNDVVIFEAREKSGGLNEYGIAKYKLTGDFAQKEVDFLLSIGGIEVQHGRALGDNLQLKDLHAQYDAVFLGLGLNASRQLGLTGEDAPGLMAAVDYIAALRQAERPGRAAGAAARHRDRRRQHRDRHGGADQAPGRRRRDAGLPPRLRSR